MTLSKRATLHLAVVGLALVTAAVRPAEAASSWSVAAGGHPGGPAPFHTTHAAASAPRHAVVRRTPHHRRPPRSVRKAVRVTARRPHRVVHGPSTWSTLNAAIARMPSYHSGQARWVVSSRYGHWGTTDWYHDTIYIEASVPPAYVYSVAVHEWSHELSVLDYGGNVDAAVAAMDRYFGGSGLVGAERAADCMAILQNATWTDYTSCSEARWRHGARVLLHGHRL